MSGVDEDVVEQQASITSLLFHYVQAPLGEGLFLRGILPASDAVRLVVGAAGAAEVGELTAFEIPLVDDDDEPVTASMALGWVRTLASEGRAKPDASVMGMELVRVHPACTEIADATGDDRAMRVLRTLAWPFVEEPPTPALCGFLFTGTDRMRLYLAVQEAGGMVGADVRLAGAVTALLAALPSLVGDEETWTVDEADPHCVRTVDLTHW
ncbi:hypothetical protein [Streptomyces sp. NPDC057302]|uniref:hypothetical protein n=1 Tax=Streptomyces sp. NPDC057302 TaxID=3346094 RepID=UPI0036446701